MKEVITRIGEYEIRWRYDEIDQGYVDVIKDGVEARLLECISLEEFIKISDEEFEDMINEELQKGIG